MNKKKAPHSLPHPWHGIKSWQKESQYLNAFIEMTPVDSVKYEIDKETGFLMVDRPQKFSNIVPALYGFVPQTYCGEKVADICMKATGKEGIEGDTDPVDICVLTERNIAQGYLIVPAIPIGGLRMIDKGEADDKIIAILKGDEVFSGIESIEDCPPTLVDRLKHYFLTYKQIPGDETVKVEIAEVYGREKAMEVIKASEEDYHNRFEL
ncbi:MAG: inorganic pyrophosphatase [Cyclobacteriaceae bacterium]